MIAEMPEGCAISILDDGVEIRCPEKRRLFRKNPPARVVSFTWREVTNVFVFKRDLFIIDSIRMLFELNGTQTIEISEDMEGWSTVVEALPVHLPGAMAQNEWWQRVVSRTFETCWTKYIHVLSP
jgi:hypothetical protein